MFFLSCCCIWSCFQLQLGLALDKMEIWITWLWKERNRLFMFLFAILCIFIYPANINEQVNADHWAAFFLINAFPHNKLWSSTFPSKCCCLKYSLILQLKKFFSLTLMQLYCFFKYPKSAGRVPEEPAQIRNPYLFAMNLNRSFSNDLMK